MVPSPFNQQFVSRSFGLSLQNGLSAFTILFEIKVDDSESCIPLGVYDASTLDEEEGILTFSYLKGLSSYLVGLGEGSGTLEITKCDLENKLISGKFDGILKQGVGDETIVISDGVFENVCFSE